MLLEIIAFAAAFFFAANIGASGTAAAMGAAYGGGALGRRSTAVLLVAVFAVLGAVFGGGEVVTTISKGIIPTQYMTVPISIMILASAGITLFAANRLGIPLSTSEVAVGSIVGVGMAFRDVYWGKVLFMVAVWLVLPFVAFAIAFLIGRFARTAERRLLQAFPRSMPKLLAVLLVAMGCYEAFSAGMNNVANAIGPLVGAGMIGASAGIVWGALFLAAGAIAMGGKVLETNGKKITRLTLMQGSIVSFTSGSLVVIASLFGLPVPLTQATTMAIMGVGSETIGRRLFGQPIVRKIFKVWLYSPFFSMLVSLSLVELVIHRSYLYAACLACSVLFAGAHYYRQHSRKQKLSVTSVE